MKLIFIFIFFHFCFLFYFFSYHISDSLLYLSHQIITAEHKMLHTNCSKKCLKIQQINFMLFKQQTAASFSLQETKSRKLQNEKIQNMKKKIMIFLIKNINNFKTLINNISSFY